MMCHGDVMLIEFVRANQYCCMADFAKHYADMKPLNSFSESSVIYGRNIVKRAIMRGLIKAKTIIVNDVPTRTLLWVE